MEPETDKNTAESLKKDSLPPIGMGTNPWYAVAAWLALPVFMVVLPASLWQPPILWLIYGVYAIGLVAAGRCALDAKRWWSKGLFVFLSIAYVGIGWFLIRSGLRELLG